MTSAKQHGLVLSLEHNLYLQLLLLWEAGQSKRLRILSKTLELGLQMLMAAMKRC